MTQNERKNAAKRRNFDKAHLPVAFVKCISHIFLKSCRTRFMKITFMATKKICLLCTNNAQFSLEVITHQVQ